MPEITPQQLYKAIASTFNLGELRTLAFDLGIDYEDLEGSSRTTKALALVQYAQRHSALNQLIDLVRRARPKALPPGATAAPPDNTPPTPEGTTTTPAQPTIVVQGDYVAGDKTGGDKVEGDKITVGNITNSTGIAIGRGASAQVNINAPQDREEFARQLAELKALLEQAIAAGEVKQADGETALEDLQDVVEEVEKEQPRTNRMKRRLEDVGEVVNDAAKTGRAILKATPILAGLIKAINVIF